MDIRKLLSGGKNDIIGAAMDGLVLRNQAIADNIANADTPNYKKKNVEFEDRLADAVKEYKETGKLDLSDARPSVSEPYSGFRYRLDGNNVDIDNEMVDLSENQIRYNALANCYGFKKLEMVLKVK